MLNFCILERNQQLQISTVPENRLRKKHFKVIKIHPDSTSSYINSRNCPSTQETPVHIFEVQDSATNLYHLRLPHESHTCQEAHDVATAVVEAFEAI